MSSEVTTLIQGVGIPMACLLGFAFAVWSALKWAAVNILKPMADRHIEFLTKLEQALVQQTQILHDHGERLTDIEHALTTRKP